MKHFLHSGCLLRSVFEVELKMSSFLYQRNVPRGKIVIQIGSKGRKKTGKKGVGADRQNPSGAFCSCAIIQDRILQVDSSATFIFLWRDILKIYWIALNRGIRNPFKLRNACCWHQQVHYLFISLSLLLQNCTTKVPQFESGALNVRSFFYQSL